MDIINIDWKARVENPMFWITILGALAFNVLTYFGLTAADITSWNILFETMWQALSNPYVIGTTLIEIYTIVINFDTKGLSD